MKTYKQLLEKINIAKAKMGDVIKDFQDSDAPQFKGKSDEKRRQMAIAAKLEADRGVKEETDIEEEAPKGYGGKSVTGSRAGSWKTNRSMEKATADAKAYAAKYAGMSDDERRAAARKSKMKEEVEQTDEALKGNQHKIDANKNGKVDGHDFKILRNAKKARYQ
jgi:hypothetical protein